jgi:formyltetrahydrofolate deformylase
MEPTAVLLIDCPDRPGLVARVASLLYERGANILHADQHQDHELGLFFMRVEWALAEAGTEGPKGQGPREKGTGTIVRAEPASGAISGADTQSSSAAWFDLAVFERDFAPLANELNMHWTLTSSARRPRVAVFCSQYLHCMADLLERWHSGELHCEIPVIVSNHRAVEKLAAFYGVPFEHIPVIPATRDEAEGRQLELLAAHRVDLIVLARYMQILSPAFVACYPSAIINVHHSFLPAFVGARPYHAAHARGVKLIGATSHYVTEVLDDGPIIEQDVSRISHRDQVDDLVARGRDLERIVLSRAVRWHLDRRILRYGNKTVVFD